MKYRLNVSVLVFVVTFASTVLGQLEVRRLARGLSQPIYLTSAPGDDDRLFVVEKGGDIEIIDRHTGERSDTPFLDVSDQISTNSERGLLGLAFHPDYVNNGLFFVNLTNRSGTTEIRQYQVSENPSLADASTSVELMSVSQPFSNHNGGWIDFGHDGFLYAALGDGGSGDDPENTGQRLSTHLGKMLRIDVNGDDFPEDANRNYAIPPTNPFANDGDDSTLAEIWAYGLRNPWRNSFDSVTGDLYIGDVGQNAREEINFQNADSVGGENYGWRLREGDIRTPGSVGGAAPADNVDPVYDYLHGGGDNRGNSVTGGYVYRGPISELQGNYFFGDFANSRIWSIEVDRESNSMVADSFTDWTDAFDPDLGSIGSISSFGEDNLGNLYVLDFNGEVFAVVPEPNTSSMLLGGLVLLATQRRNRLKALESALSKLQPALAPEVAKHANCDQTHHR